MPQSNETTEYLSPTATVESEININPTGKKTI